MKTRMSVGLVMLMLLVGLSAPADADVLCANPSGSVFLRTQYKGNDTQLNPVALGLVGPQGPEGPEGPEGPAGPTQTTRRFPAPTLIPPGQGGESSITCLTGEKAMGGGYHSFPVQGQFPWSVIVTFSTVHFFSAKC